MLWILLCLALLFGQAMCDLSLPSLMSNIVNIGIQKGGIKETAPNALSADAMKLCRPSCRRTIRNIYKPVTNWSRLAVRQRISKIPEIETFDIYVRTGGDPDRLGAIFAAPPFHCWRILRIWPPKAEKTCLRKPAAVLLKV